MRRPADLTPNELDRQLLRGSDAAFVGRLVTIVPLGEGARPPFHRGDYLFRIEQQVKGDLPFRWVVVRATIGGSVCGLELRVGTGPGSCSTAAAAGLEVRAAAPDEPARTAPRSAPRVD